MVFRGQIGSQETDDRKNNRFFLIFWIKDDETQISIHEDIENGNVQLIWLFLFFFLGEKEVIQPKKVRKIMKHLVCHSRGNTW